MVADGGIERDSLSFRRLPSPSIFNQTKPLRSFPS
jgi:hypothetical protein